MITVLQGDCLDVLRTLPDESVHCCVTSPPYWGLRDYGCAGQIGLEPTPEAYVAKMVEVFREVRRVLRDDGTLWLNLGDSYSRAPEKGGSDPGNKGNAHNGLDEARKAMRRGSGRADGIVTEESPRNRDGAPPCDLPQKNLIGIPWRVAFALQADGWYLRSDIIWAKPNPMPESVTDRPTKAHEYIFLLSKSERYWYDAEAIAEPVTCDRLRGSGPMVQPGTGRNDTAVNGDYRTNGKWSKEHPQSSGRRIVERVAEARANGADHDSPFGNTRNKRSVWVVSTRSYKEAHFATFPPDLIKPCILAGVPVGGTVLDPFGGSGTTGMVALELGRRAILIELNPKYVDLIHQRTDVTPGLPL